MTQHQPPLSHQQQYLSIYLRVYPQAYQHVLLRPSDQDLSLRISMDNLYNIPTPGAQLYVLRSNKLFDHAAFFFRAQIPIPGMDFQFSSGITSIWSSKSCPGPSRLIDDLIGSDAIRSRLQSITPSHGRDACQFASGNRAKPNTAPERMTWRLLLALDVTGHCIGRRVACSAMCSLKPASTMTSL